MQKTIEQLSASTLHPAVEQAMQRSQAVCVRLVNESGFEFYKLGRDCGAGKIAGIYLISEPGGECLYPRRNPEQIGQIVEFVAENKIIYVGHSRDLKKRYFDHTAMSVEEQIVIYDQEMRASFRGHGEWDDDEIEQTDRENDRWNRRYRLRPITSANTLAFEMAKKQQQSRFRKMWSLKGLLRQHQDVPSEWSTAFMADIGERLRHLQGCEFRWVEIEDYSERVAAETFCHFALAPEYGTKGLSSTRP